MIQSLDMHFLTNMAACYLSCLYKLHEYLHWFINRVTGATSFKEGYFFGAFSILPDTSFLLWTKIYFFGNKTMKFDLFPLFWDQNTVFYREIYQKSKILSVKILLRMICQKLMSNDTCNFVIFYNVCKIHKIIHKH